MNTYLELLRDVTVNGVYSEDRTGVGTYRVFGRFLTVELNCGFPALTTKRLAFKKVVGELLGFIRGYTSAAQFRQLGCDIWDQNANENQAWLKNPNRKGIDDLGHIYGHQWRSQNGVDQFMNMIWGLSTDPTSRRHLISAWIPSELPYMALPPCHVLHQVAVFDDTLEMMMYQRSADLFLGLPFNIASYALLAQIYGDLTGLKPTKLCISIGDAHVYSNHIEQVKEQLGRQVKQKPKLRINWPEENKLQWLLEHAVPDDFQLEDYNPHPAIKAPMAV